MIKIRNCTFETNSSSCHSISINSVGEREFKLPVSYDGYVYVIFDEYGWGIEDYNSQADRLSYLVTLLYAVWHKSIDYYLIDYKDEDEIEENLAEFLQTPDMIYINECVKRMSNYTCNGIKLDYSYCGVGYVDHQSGIDLCHNLDDFLNVYSINHLEDYLFGEDVELHIDNDNH